METLVKKEELKKVLAQIPFLPTSLAEAMMKVLKLDQINQLYTSCYTNDTLAFIEAIFHELHIRFDCSESDLEHIPAEGPFIAISNHPYGGLDGLILLYLILKKRPDFKLMANFLLKRVKPLEDRILAVNPFEDVVQSSLKGLKESFAHISGGAPLGIFPAGEVSTYHRHKKTVTDKIWSPSVIKFIKKARVPIVPVYFDGSNSLAFHLLGIINPKLRSVRLPSELFNKKNKAIKIRIGKAIPIKEQEKINSNAQFGRYLRTRTYALASNIEIKKYYKTPALQFPEKAQDIIPPVDPEKLQAEIAAIAGEHKLFQIKHYEAYCAPSFKIPHLLNEIGRLREVTFRKVGEGTHKSCDLDEYDLYYNHLFLWDKEAEKLVGAYRIGEGKEIIHTYGKKGFYTNSLFKFKKRFNKILRQSLELGRSFIIPEYQQKALPLFLLWKGILYFLIKNSDYKYLIGPVSISNEYSDFSRQLIVEFIRSNHFDHKTARQIRPRHRFNPDLKDLDFSSIIELTKDNISRLDTYIREIDERNLSVPVLLKKYVKQNAKIIGFNLDPKFSDCLDGLILLNLREVPEDIINSLSEEIEDKELLQVFQRKKGKKQALLINEKTK